MRTSRRRAMLGLLAAGVVRAQTLTPQIIHGDEDTPRRLPNGKLQTDAILKSEYDQNVKDAQRLASLAKSIEAELDDSDEYVLSLSMLKKLEDIEKISKRMQSRIRH
ncbi:MAG TPA: hypothetical protein VFT60_14255 [Bryobacteraceae bacterium]|nr:hypothetical protein [Bryobacteraceae bacterium]